MKPTRVLVTGGAGFIGSHTVDALRDRGHEVVVLDSLQPRVHPKGKPPWVPADIRFVHGDVADSRALLSALDGVRAVYHLAAYQDYLTDFSEFIRVNTQSTALLFELIVEHRLPVEKIVFASSQSVAGEGVYRCGEHGTIVPGPRPIEQLRRAQWEIACPSCGREMEPQLIDEETCSPHTTYAISKYAIELLADRLGRRYGVPTTCVRYTYVQGPRNSFYNAYSGICRIFAMRLLHGQAPVVYEDGKQLRDYVNVLDVARANLSALEHSEADFTVLNIGGGRAITVREFAELVIATVGSDLAPVVAGEFRVGDTRHTVSDLSRIRALGWEPTIPVEENVRAYVEWLREQEGSAAYLEEAERIMHDRHVVQRASATA